MDDEDIINKPSHYALYQIEPIEFIMQNNLSFHAGNIVKYACRAGLKQYEGKTETQSETQDLLKIIRYAEFRINQIQGKTPNAI